MSPTQRTLAFIRKQGLLCAITEHWNSFARIRQDLFGCIDVLIIDPPKLTGIQCTSRSNHSTRVNKILKNHAMKEWLKCAELRVFSWKKGEKLPKVTTFELNQDQEIEAWNWT